MVGATHQAPKIESEPEVAITEPTATESDRNASEMVGAAQENTTKSVQQTQEEVTTQSNSAKSQNDEDGDGMVGMALPSVSEATVEQIDAVQTRTESAIHADGTVSDPMEAPKDESQVTAEEKVGQKW